MTPILSVATTHNYEFKWVDYLTVKTQDDAMRVKPLSEASKT